MRSSRDLSLPMQSALYAHLGVVSRAMYHVTPSTGDDLEALITLLVVDLRRHLRPMINRGVVTWPSYRIPIGSENATITLDVRGQPGSVRANLHIAVTLGYWPGMTRVFLSSHAELSKNNISKIYEGPASGMDPEWCVMKSLDEISKIYA